MTKVYREITVSWSTWTLPQNNEHLRGSAIAELERSWTTIDPELLKEYDNNYLIDEIVEELGIDPPEWPWPYGQPS